MSPSAQARQAAVSKKHRPISGTLPSSRRALSAAVPYVRLSDRWTTSYAGFFYSTYPLFDRAHCAAISAYAPINNDEYGWNKDYRRLQWYHAAGFDQAGW